MFNYNPLVMFLNLAHTRLDVFKQSQDLALECYKISKMFPNDEKFAMSQQLRRAALSVHLNLAEGCSRKSKAERSRFFEVSRGSVVEIDTCLDVAVRLNYVTREELNQLGQSIVIVFKLLSGMIKGLVKTLVESRWKTGNLLGQFNKKTFVKK